MDGVRLLIVDGDESVRSVIKEKAAAEGFACDEAADGIAAIKLFRRYDYSLILLDTELPQLDGRNVCRQIRKVSDTPIIIVSARSSEEDRLTGFDLGADDYVLKPFSTCELMARVKVFLRRSGGIGRVVPRKIPLQRPVHRHLHPACLRRRLVARAPTEGIRPPGFSSQNPNAVRGTSCSTRYGGTTSPVPTGRWTRTSRLPQEG